MCDRNFPYRPSYPAEECPIAFCTKWALFLAVVAFIIFVPVGDPDEQCKLSSLNQSRTLCCVCKIYKNLILFACKVIDIIDAVICGIVNTLYEVKLRLYGVLEWIDGDDLCRFTCQKPTDATKNQAGHSQGNTNVKFESPKPSRSGSFFNFKQ